VLGNSQLTGSGNSFIFRNDDSEAVSVGVYTVDRSTVQLNNNRMTYTGRATVVDIAMGDQAKVTVEDHKVNMNRVPTGWC
jgi:hypothetical protein